VDRIALLAGFLVAGCDPCLETRTDVSTAEQCPAHCGLTCMPVSPADQICGDALRSCLAQISAHNALPCAADHCRDPQECLNIPDFLGLPGDPAPNEQEFMDNQDCYARCWQCEEGIESPEPGCQCDE